MLDDTFDLPVDATQLVNYIKGYGRKKEAAGGISWIDFEGGGFHGYRMAVVPEVTEDAEGIVLTWFYGVDQETGFYGVNEDFRQRSPCIVWRITNMKDGIRVEASCTIEYLRRHFYQMIDITTREIADPNVSGSGGQGAEGSELLTEREREVAGLLALDGEKLPSTEAKTPEGDELPDNPPIPGQSGATWDDTFDWYYRAGRGKCPTLKRLAVLISMDYGTVRKEHPKYTAQYGKKPMPRLREQNVPPE